MVGWYHSIRSRLRDRLHTVHDVLRTTGTNDKQKQPHIEASAATVHLGDILFGYIDYRGGIEDDAVELH